MDDVDKIKKARSELMAVAYDNKQASALVVALAVGWGLAQIGKGLLSIGAGVESLASAARLGYFQS